MLFENKTKVCILTSVHKPFDDRIFHKQAVTLANTGYRVSLVVPHDKNEVVSDVHLIRVRASLGRLSRMTSMQLKMLGAAFRENSDIYHFHDPELIVVGLILKLVGKKVIYDVHELVYYQIEDKNWIHYGWVKKAAQFVYRRFEWLSVKIFDRIILAEDDYLNYFEGAYGKSSKYCIIRNSPIIALIDSAQVVCLQEKSKTIVIYAGGLTRHRGIKEIVDAMSLVGGRAELYLLGDWESTDFMHECERLDGWVYTKYLGFRPLNEVYSLMKAADIGIAVLHPIKNYLTSLPIKVFEYMACSLPVVVSNFPCWQKIFGECALFVDPSSPDDIARKIIKLIDNPSLAQSMLGKGKKLLLAQYNWDIESIKLLELYGTLINEN